MGVSAADLVEHPRTRIGAQLKGRPGNAGLKTLVSSLRRSPPTTFRGPGLRPRIASIRHIVGGSPGRPDFGQHQRSPRHALALTRLPAAALRVVHDPRAVPQNAAGYEPSRCAVRSVSTARDRAEFCAVLMRPIPALRGRHVHQGRRTLRGDGDEDVEPVELGRCAAVVAAQHAYIGEADRGEQGHDLVRGVHVRDEGVGSRARRARRAAIATPSFHGSRQSCFNAEDAVEHPDEPIEDLDPTDDADAPAPDATPTRQRVTRQRVDSHEPTPASDVRLVNSLRTAELAPRANTRSSRTRAPSPSTERVAGVSTECAWRHRERTHSGVLERLVGGVR